MWKHPTAADVALLHNEIRDLVNGALDSDDWSNERTQWVAALDRIHRAITYLDDTTTRSAL
ncbi:hypothetical protein [Nocardia africana]